MDEEQSDSAHYVALFENLLDHIQFDTSPVLQYLEEELVHVGGLDV
jgi:hypothetical protein